MVTMDIVAFSKSPPTLPTELIRDVIELAAHSDTAVTGLSLALVSKFVNIWVTPIIYRTVVLDTRDRILSFNSNIETAQCASIDNSIHVLNLAIRGSAMSQYAWTLSICRRVRQLLLKPRNDSDVENSTPLWPRPWLLMLLRSHNDWIAGRNDVFTKTTHLYLGDGLGSTSITSCLSLPLTHICLGFWEDEDDTTNLVSNVEILLDSPFLKLVMIHVLIGGHGIDDFFGGIWVELAEIEDERLIVAPGKGDDELLDIFESGKTVWDNAALHKGWREMVRS